MSHGFICFISFQLSRLRRERKIYLKINLEYLVVKFSAFNSYKTTIFIK